MKVEPFAEKIIDMYVNQNMNTVQIAEYIGCSDSGVGRVLKRHGIPRVHTPNELKITPEQAVKICDMYTGGMTTIEIAPLFGICDNSVAKILRLNGIEVRNAVRRSIIKKHDYFHVIDTPGKAYFLGWMISDGAVVEHKTRQNRATTIALELQEKDRHIIEMFATELGADESSVKDFQKRSHAHLRFASDEMANDLAQYGVIPNKSWISHLPVIRKDLMPHLIRGIFDGDGTVTIDKRGDPHFAFYGSQGICEDIRDYLHETIGLNKNTVSKTTCYHIWWGGKTTATTFYNYVYDSCGKYYLERKKSKFDLSI